MSPLIEIIQSKPYLTWYVKDKSSLSEKSMFEHILGFGNWEDFLETQKYIGVKKSKTLFEQIKNSKRINLKPSTLNYFNHYFDKYAQ